MHANLQDINDVTLESNMMFSKLQVGQPNAFTIKTSTEVQAGQCAIGIARANSSVFIVPAFPGNTVVIPEPNNQYFVGYGKYQEGEVIDCKKVNE